MSKPMQTCRQVLNEVIICSYTTTNWTLLALGLTAAAGGTAILIARRTPNGSRTNQPR